MALIFLLLQTCYSRDGCHNRYLGSTYPTAERRRTSKRQYTTYLDGTVSSTPQYDSLIITSHAHSAKDVIRPNALICPRTSPSDTGSWIEDTRLERLGNFIHTNFTLNDCNIQAPRQLCFALSYVSSTLLSLGSAISHKLFPGSIWTEHLTCRLSYRTRSSLYSGSNRARAGARIVARQYGTQMTWSHRSTYLISVCFSTILQQGMLAKMCCVALRFRTLYGVPPCLSPPTPRSTFQDNMRKRFVALGVTGLDVSIRIVLRVYRPILSPFMWPKTMLTG
ncbi:hypothetical protein CCUS01_09931 [Colletotrichum cuscutae]|uniref:Uncharacterized protein n=1 Tax=Colletotrichum cuscutae TaxID=1209917 RepID=A0AAI9XQR7_9PEZI|nr:hypothetical protein CCUS01_09931 [Colletotrichum cuscutae]